MRALAAIAAVVVAASAPAVGSAEVLLGVRGGYAIPTGAMEQGMPLKDHLQYQLPVTLDLGFRIGQTLVVGAYAGYGFGEPSAAWRSACAALGASCSSQEQRIGGQLVLEAAGSTGAAPWLGLTLGWSELRERQAGGTGVTFDRRWKGYEAAVLGGLDLRLGAGFSIGPFASATLGSFGTIGDSTPDLSIDRSAIHGWIQVGLRGVLGL